MKTRKVKFTIEETVSQDFEMEVRANATEEEIRKLISEGYFEEEFVLEPGELVCAKANIIGDDGAYISDNWEEIA